MLDNNTQNESARRKRVGGVGTAVIFFVLGALVGFFVDLRGIFLNRSNVSITKVLDLYSQTRSSDVSFNQFWEVWDKIKSKYVSQPVTDSKLFYGSIEGLVRSLGDPYSAYFPPQKAAEFAADLAGEFEGIGAEIGIRREQLIVIAPLPGSPAEAAGLRKQDKILKIDNLDSYGLSLDEAVSKIRGRRGTTVKLTIYRDGEKENREVVITRQKINVPTVSWEKKDGAVAYIRVSYFNETTGKEFDKIVREVVGFKPKGIILDLRSNPGGYLDRSIIVASEWIAEGVIVRERFVDQDVREYGSSGQHRFSGIKTVVLVDEGTASGAEIVAGALQDTGAAKVVGKKTYGKGSVQDFEPLADGSALKLTIAKWLTPKNREIDGKGIEPDIVINEMFEKKSEKSGEEPVDYIDRGMEKAMELLKN